MVNGVASIQLASEKPADLDLHCFFKTFSIVRVKNKEFFVVVKFS